MVGEGVPEPQRVSKLKAAHLPVDMLSIAVFGPGDGEAVVVRLPTGEVGVVDGCREPTHATGAGDPVRELLSDLGVRNLEFVCVTHAHRDHYRGVGRLLESNDISVKALWKPPGSVRYLQALLAKLEAEDLLPLVRSDQDSAGLRRLLAAIHAHRERGVDLVTQARRRPLLWDPQRPNEASIWCCGPSDADGDRAEEAIVACLDSILKRRAKLREPIDLNYTSGALLLQWQKARILLAGDLLNGEGRLLGWKDARTTIGTDPVQVVNVAHHASEGAHDEALWASMKPVLAIVTPFQHGNPPYPPKPDMIRKLCGTSTVAITSPPRWAGQDGVGPAHLQVVATNLAARNAAITHHPTGATPTVIPPAGVYQNDSAVAVSLDASGQIRAVTLAGLADIYRAAPR